MTAYLRIRDLSEDARIRLHTEIAELIVQTVCYPPFFDHSAGLLSMRPWSVADRERARAFVNGTRLDELDTTPFADQQFVERIRAILLRYQDAQNAGRIFLSPQMDVTPMELDLQIRRMQKRFMNFVQGNDQSFGISTDPPSWQDNRDIDRHLTGNRQQFVHELTNALLLMQGEQTMDREHGPSIEPIAVAATPQDELTAIETRSLPIIELAQAAAPQMPTVRLPEAIELPNESERRRDSAIFQQVRSQLLERMEAACRAYGIAYMPDDPAGILSALRQSGAIDEPDLHLAEGILALCQRVIERGRADIEEYRQAMILYVLFHRSRFATMQTT